MNKPFTVAWKNPEEPIPSQGMELVECGVCGKKIHPLDVLGVYMLPINRGLASYEHPFFVCSESCDKNAEQAKAKKKKQLE